MPAGYAAQGGDCDDADPAVNPGAVEVCNGNDDNCSGTVDEGVGATYYLDTDGDTYGLDSATTQACSLPAGYAAQGGDCDDADPAVSPGASEACANGLDDNCNGFADEDCGGDPLLSGSFAEQYADLVPADATLAAYDSDRFSVVTGLVQGRDELPLEGVVVTVHGLPEYGSAVTDTEGRFSLPLDGGTTFTVVYEKAGYLTSHRRVYVPWNEIAIAETLQMIGTDPAATLVTFDGDPATVVRHQSTQVTDEFGSRSTTLVFTGDNRAWVTNTDGNEVEVATVTTRATEYDSPVSMPAKLPPTSAYTYCTELSVDEGETVRFEQPVTMYVDNFLGFAVGEIVPVGYYDRERAVWVPSDNGVVVKLLDTDSDDVVDALDSNGDDLADDLDGDGSFSDEVMGLEDSALYAANSTYWRAEVTHFTPWDC
ncbi:MAG: putative metal-binding motif-containing protein, partial [Deferrisomatales bacterium]|nr:putative metal-binding motif-containing protein [Deferrisomatales bacterium]